MTSPVLTVDVADRIATLTLNRPERRNALNADLRRGLRDAVRETEANDEVDVVILTGADPAFCAGLDLTEFASADSGLRDGALLEGRERGPLGPHEKPVIGAVNGAAVTGGLELALACDFIIASEHARFADTHARVGVLPGWGLTVLLPEAVGLRRAREMSATGNYVDAQRALVWGLVNRIVAHGELLDTCRSTYNRTTATTADEGWRIEADVHRDWTRANLDATTTSRLMAVIDRGRSQVSGQAKGD